MFKSFECLFWIHDIFLVVICWNYKRKGNSKNLSQVDLTKEKKRTDNNFALACDSCKVATYFTAV